MLMGVFYVAQWSVRPADEQACNEALQVIRDHIEKDHAVVQTVRVFRQAYGGLPRRSYLWMEEYPSLTAMESDVETEACKSVWKPIEDMAQPGTYVTSLWGGSTVQLDRKK
jgi:hypothetical protein